MIREAFSESRTISCAKKHIARFSNSSGASKLSLSPLPGTNTPEHNSLSLDPYPDLHNGAEFEDMSRSARPGIVASP